jgi:integrase
MDCISEDEAKSVSIRIEGERINGKRQQKFKTIKGSYKDAQRELAKMLAAADAGVLVDPTSQTVASYLTDFFDSVQTLSPKTLERYVELAQRQITPHIGDVKLQKLTPELIERWHATLIKTGLSARTVGHAHRVLSRVLRRAVENGTLARNVAAIRKPPKVEQQEVDILSADQITIVLNCLADHPLHPIAVLALATGARRGELLALKWADVDLDRGTIRIERSLEETKAGFRIKPPKTKRGRRSIRIASDAVTVLKAHLKQQRELRLQLGIGGQPTLLFSTLEGNLLSPDNLSRDWRRICTARKLPRCCFHALRHTHASMLISLGWDILKVSRRLGHDKPSTTLNVYGHLIKDTDDAAVAQMEGMLK